MLNIALIGCGTMGRTHSNGYKNIKNAKVVAFCDLSSEKAQPLCAAHGAELYTDFELMLKEVSFDILDICLPTYLHHDFALRAMQCGKNVFCEKPVALTEAQAEDMISASEKYNVKFSVGHVLRFFPSYIDAENQIKSGRLGVPRLIRTVRNQAFPAWSWQGWYKDYAKSGGPILDLVIHDLDWIIKNIGDVERVYAKSFNGKVENQEHCMLILRLKNGAIAHVEGSWAYPRGAAFHTSYEIVGTKAQLEYDSIKDAPIVKQTAENDVHSIAYLSPVPSDREPYTAELQQFIDCVHSNTQPPVTGQEALKVLRVARAAVRSSETGLPVML